MKVSIVIPARLGSSRLAGKILKPLGGIPILRRVLDRVSKIREAEEVLVLVDEQEVMDLVDSWGFRVLLTSKDCISGTERIISVVDQLEGDFVLNVQSDEPFIPLDPLNEMISIAKNSSADILTVIYPITSSDILFNPNRVKVVIDKDDYALYFSRNAIPFLRDISEQERWPNRHTFWGHLGVYGYRKNILRQYATFKEGILEQAERLEQLRFLENGIMIRCIRGKGGSISIDTEEDLLCAEEFLRSHSDL
ncbi:MAG: 3-deoxy-manno-octulosonate cytidylyltransferase [Puniceicoccales bacterium]|jgi:3-deoxy-manno-octulosonate cytidylyltransferase (CMP-KDO synthetase)|nr:3-deoxy-manno-octulosonate cytidylyltransferase [Puniceicoccales bacterium]